MAGKDAVRRTLTAFASLSEELAAWELDIAGLTFSSEDTADLADKIETLAQSTTLCRQLGINTRKKLMGSSYTMAYEAWDRVISSAFSSEDNRAAFR